MASTLTFTIILTSKLNDSKTFLYKDHLMCMLKKMQIFMPLTQKYCLVAWNLFFFLINLFILFIYYFWLCWVFIAARGLLLSVVCGLLIAVASLVVKHGL